MEVAEKFQRGTQAFQLEGKDSMDSVAEKED